MRLVKLEIKGFKSFAKETVLHFGEDVIGVVGPNGSGKSNIVDAIRWVLGEQKKGELRLDKMSSVIFNGTKKRKAGNVAQVFLTFDNNKGVLRSEFQTITIGRLLYRNGDSEYRLNGVPCRRKDITDLFVDTGIESNSYAIIALGMVDDILADKDNSRLRMLEQAAGISVYKVRKKETLNRLRRTQEDLDRVEDLLHEIDGNLADLEKQAKRTKKYFEIKEQYRELSLDFAFVSSRELREQTEKVVNELSEAEKSNTDQSTEVNRLEELVEKTKREQLTEEQHLAERRRQLGQVIGKLRSATNEKQLAEQKIEYLSQNQGKLAGQRDKLSDELVRLKESVAGYEKRLVAAKEEREAYQITFEAAKSALTQQQSGADNLRSAVRERAQALQQAERELLDLDRQVNAVQSKIEAIEAEALNQARRGEAILNRLKEARSAAQQAEERLGGLAAKLQEAEDHATNREKREAELRDQIDQLIPQLQEQRGKLQQKENEYSLIQSMLDRMEGSPESIKFLATKQGWRDKYQQLSDVLDIKAEFKVAVEAVLSPYLSCFIVPTQDIAAEGLRVLAEAKKDRTTILISEVESAGVTAFAKTGAENLTSARSVVTTDDAYKALVDLLLEGVFVLDDGHEQADVSAGETLIDRAGKELWTPYSARGGKTSKLQGKLTGRRKQAEQLAKDVDALVEEVGQLDAKRVDLNRSLQELRSQSNRHDLKDLRRRHSQAERKLATEKAKVDSFQQQVSERGNHSEEVKVEIAELQQKLTGFADQRVTLASARDAAYAQQSSADEEAETHARALSEASGAYNQANMTSIQLDNKVAAFERELKYAQDQLAEVSTTLKENDAALNSDGSEIGTLHEQVAELKARIQEGKATRDAQQDKLNEDEKAYFQQRNQLAEWEKNLRQQQREVADLTSLVTRLRERKTELNYRLQNLKDRLEIEFNLDLEAAVAEEREVKQSLADLERKIGKLKNRLDNYGEINPLAVEAYDAMNERHGNIAGQREDILNAMESLQETIEEIDRNATEKLTDAFEAVRGHFTEVFRHLFDAEDTADMVMLDPENPLESKIEIIAKPKGKRPQTISQLSGGEKTLTATAFLFALYLIKPAPFCIFDEVDAPLDDTNVEKFNRIIKRFSTGSQFIIVTHNKLTMAAVDTIYGVYMPELGVSSVTPVDFREFEHSDVLTMVG